MALACVSALSIVVRRPCIGLLPSYGAGLLNCHVILNILSLLYLLLLLLLLLLLFMSVRVFFKSRIFLNSLAFHARLYSGYYIII